MTADTAIWPGVAGMEGRAYEGAEVLGLASYKNVQHWTELVGARPAVPRGRMANRIIWDPASQLNEQHDRRDFKTTTQRPQYDH